MVRQADTVAYINGQMVPYAKAVTEIAAGEAASPAGFFDAQRTFKGTVFKLREHFERLYSALKFARVDTGLGLDQMEAATLEVVGANTPSQRPDGDLIVGQILNVRPMKRTDGPTAVDVFIYCQAIDFSRFARGYAMGVRIITPSKRRRCAL